MRNINQIRILLILFSVGLALYFIFAFPINLGLDLQGGTRLVLEATPTKEVKVSEDAVKGVVAVIRNRIDALGVSEPIIQRKGRKQIIVELPGVKNPERAIKLIGDTAMLKFVEALWAPADESVLTQEKVTEIYGVDARLEIFETSGRGSAPSRRPIILKKTALTGADLKGAWPGTDEYGNPLVDIEFKGKGIEAFRNATARSVGKPLAILLDDKIISAPNVNEPIPSGRARISGSFSIEEVQDLVIKLKAGALPIPVKTLETKIVGPTLGKDSVEKSKFAGMIGLVIILIFMMFYYRLPGLMANLALIIYTLIVFGILSAIRTTLTLPGIAGFLLSIGMAVDANIIIFERLKEEVRSGKTIKMSIEAAFKRAISAILDSNVTTLIAAATLFWLGTGTIKGFAITLSIGILASMLSAIVITHCFLDLLADGKILKDSKTGLIKR